MSDNTQNTQILLKRSDVPGSVPLPEDLAIGEPAINVHDGKLFFKLVNGKVIDISSTAIGNTYYVTTNGDDSLDGTTPGRAKASIRQAVALAKPGDTVEVSTGTYIENTPIMVPQSVQVKGSGERGCVIQPVDANNDIFYVNNNSYVTGFKYINYAGSAISFPNIIESGQVVYAGPTIGVTNVVILPPNSYNIDEYYTGMSITITNGSQTGVTRNIVSYQGVTRTATLDQNWLESPAPGSNYILKLPLRYTPATVGSKWSTYITGSPYIYNSSSITSLGGTGITVDGSLATGNKSIIAAQFTQVNSGGTGIHILNDGYSQLVSIYGIFCDTAFLAESGGTASLGNCNVNFGNKGLVAKGKGSLAMSATVSQNNGEQTFTLNVNNIIANTSLGVSANVPYIGLIMKIDGDASDSYYIVSDSTPVNNGNTTITFSQAVANSQTTGTTVKFYQQSQLRASGQTFEYVGAGTDITAIPRLGGIANTQAQTITIDEGAVYATSTDQSGNFSVSDLTINQDTSTITGRTFSKSLFAEMTPYILALEG